MKADAESRINTFNQQLEKFAARWHQLKPQDINMDSDHEVCVTAMASLSDRRAEFDELLTQMEKLKYEMLCITYVKTKVVNVAQPLQMCQQAFIYLPVQAPTAYSSAIPMFKKIYSFTMK